MQSRTFCLGVSKRNQEELEEARERAELKGLSLSDCLFQELREWKAYKRQERIRELQGAF